MDADRIKSIERPETATSNGASGENGTDPKRLEHYRSSRSVAPAPLRMLFDVLIAIVTSRNGD